MTPVDRRSGLRLDLALYAVSAAFAAVTAAISTLTPHRAWGAVAMIGYGLATLAVVGQLRVDAWAGVRIRGRLTGLTWVATAFVPLVAQAVQRAAGRIDRAQEEVVVVERAGERLFDTGTPYLGRDAIAALPADERLLGYNPYQPGMALFGAPRALVGDAWWTDARIWFALATIAALVGAAMLLIRADAPASFLVRAGQAATVVPICALTLATGGDDLPVLALTLLALALAARAVRAGGPGVGWWVWAGTAAGSAGALKLFAWPVALVLIVLAAAHGRRAALACGAPAVGVPVLAMLPAFAVEPGAAIENVIRFPFGAGLVTSPAQSPLPGHLIAQALPYGRVLAVGLLLAVGVAIAVRLVRRPPRDAGTAALVCAVGLTAAIGLLPSTRFGYLLYPIAYLGAVAVLRPPRGGGIDRHRG